MGEAQRRLGGQLGSRRRGGVADPADGAPVEITVHHDAARPSALLLPLVDLAVLSRDRS